MYFLQSFLSLNNKNKYNGITVELFASLIANLTDKILLV